LALLRLRASQTLMRSFYVSGAVCLVLSLAWPRLFFPLIWLAFAFLLEPLNYVLKNPSLLAEPACYLTPLSFILLIFLSLSLNPEVLALLFFLGCKTRKDTTMKEKKCSQPATIIVPFFQKLMCSMCSGRRTSQLEAES